MKHMAKCNGKFQTILNVGCNSKKCWKSTFCDKLCQPYDVIYKTSYTWADPEGGTGGPDPPLEFWQKCAYRIREMVLV